MFWILISIGTILLGYWFLIRPHKFWTEKGVKQGHTVPLFGDNFANTFRKESFPEMFISMYNKVPKERYSGAYLFLTPMLVLRDPDLIKQIAVKDFNHFLDHVSFVPEGVNPLWNNNLLALKGQNWRDMRSTLSPAFTSSKMRIMFTLISKNAEQFVKHFLEKNEDVITLEMKDTFTRFTNDVIANTAFGIEVDSLGDRNNEFYVMGKEATDMSVSGFWSYVKLLGFFLVPKLYKYLHVKIYSQNVVDFFTNLVSKNIESREIHGIVRPDMIQLLLDARKNGFKEETHPVVDTGFATVEESEVGKNGRKVEISDQDIVSQAFIFFFAGFFSVSSLMCFMSYELGVNQDIQERLCQEIDETLQESGGKITYEALLKMKYMDMVISETLRKWPNATATDRVCTKPYTITPKRPGEVPVYLEKGTIISIPIFGLHRDPEYYPEPEKFDPERFSEENKHKINPYAYLPFGVGPRNCIGSRFALLETKALFFHVLSEFQIVPIEKTQIPLKLNRRKFHLNAEGGFWFGLKKRTKSLTL